MNKQLREMYLDYFNNYLTIAKFAADNELSENDATVLLRMGRRLQEDYASMFKSD